jgi:hypothetical protein
MVFQADDMTIHYITGNNGLEIIAICPSCLENYLKKTQVSTEQKQDDIERKKMKMKW